MLDDGFRLPDLDGRRSADRTREILRTAQRCWRCDADIAAEVVWRRRMFVRPSERAYGGGPYSVVVPLCEHCACARLRWCFEAHKIVRTAVPCEACGRMVNNIERPYCLTACCEECRERAHRERRQRVQALVREQQCAKTCETCGAAFTATRRDGRYCSNACRQRAYRERTKGDQQ